MLKWICLIGEKLVIIRRTTSPLDNFHYEGQELVVAHRVMKKLSKNKKQWSFERDFVEPDKPIMLNFPLKVFSNLLGPFQQSQLFSTLRKCL